MKGYSTKRKEDLVTLLNGESLQNEIIEPIASEPTLQLPAPKSSVKRLNYIGSKYQLLEWITDIMKEKTGWDTFAEKTVADLFAGTGIVSHHFRTLGSTVISNDAELYSSIIARAFTCSTYTSRCAEVIATLNQELADKKYESSPLGFITRVYSPTGACTRMFFTQENAKRIDYLRNRLDELQRDNLTHEEHSFLVASLLMSADAVSNVPAVYGCYLKNFKAKALKELTLAPVHQYTTPASSQSCTTQSDVLADALLQSVDADIVYLDPPYNERQYSKNYFPLNMIAMSPSLPEPELHGKTGIPEGCFVSPFCKRGASVENAFEKIVKNLRYKWMFISYNSESLIGRERMIEILGKYGDVSVVERDYKRFKSFQYNENLAIKEYMFCLKRNNA